jgi:hypothetical protein
VPSNEVTEATPGLLKAEVIEAFLRSGLRIQEVMDEAGDVGEKSNFLLSLLTSFNSTGTGTSSFLRFLRMESIERPMAMVKAAQEPTMAAIW